VVRVDVSGQRLHPLDLAYMGALMDRPDVTLVVKGLAEVALPAAAMPRRRERELGRESWR
jgi:hypothetical protein